MILKTNVSAHNGNHDATTKSFVTDLLKTKAGTTYVNKELAKKANKSSLSDYAKKNEVDNLLPKSYLDRSRKTAAKVARTDDNRCHAVLREFVLFVQFVLFMFFSGHVRICVT